LAGSITCYFFTKWLYDRYLEVTAMGKKGGKDFLALNEEIHAISSGAKV
jgi:hypothetical protein